MATPCARLARGAWVLALVLAGPAGAWANVGPPTSGGQVGAEPVGVIGLAITRETLVLDLRPLAANGLARVEAVYRLNNPGPEKKLDLLFASGAGGVSDFQVTLDGRPVASAPAPDAPLPARWQAPKHTPGLGGERELEYLRHGARRVTAVAFAATV